MAISHRDVNNLVKIEVFGDRPETAEERDARRNAWRNDPRISAPVKEALEDFWRIVDAITEGSIP